MSRQKHLRIEEIKTAPVLERSTLPDVDFVIDPYIGCGVGCSYCYASKSGDEVNEPIKAWGDFVYAKVNAVDTLSFEMEKFSKNDLEDKKILLSSKTDPYQGCETTYQITRKILQYLAQKEFPGIVGILTKSPLVLRDIEIFRRFQRAEIGLTITTLDEQLARSIENHAPSARKRLETLKRLYEEGINTFAFVGPLLPHYIEMPELLEELFYGLRNAGVQSIFVEHLNFSPCVELRLRQIFSTNLQKYNLELEYENIASPLNRQRLDEIVVGLINKAGLSLRFGKVLYLGKVA